MSLVNSILNITTYLLWRHKVLFEMSNVLHIGFRFLGMTSDSKLWQIQNLHPSSSRQGMVDLAEEAAIFFNFLPETWNRALPASRAITSALTIRFRAALPFNITFGFLNPWFLRPWFLLLQVDHIYDCYHHQVSKKDRFLSKIKSREIVLESKDSGCLWLLLFPPRVLVCGS